MREDYECPKTAIIKQRTRHEVIALLPYLTPFRGYNAAEGQECEVQWST